MAVALLLAPSLAVPARAATVGRPRAVSATRPDRVGVSGADESSAPWLSGDGRIVVFSSRAGNLVTNDTNAALDAFVFDRQTQQMTLGSVNQSGNASGNGPSVALDFTTNGQWLLFQSDASDLVANDTNNATDLFLRNLASGQTTLVSPKSGGVASGSDSFNNAALSQDGRFLVFESAARGLSANDTNSFFDVYVRDLMTGSNSLVSMSLDGLGAGNGNSQNPAMTPDGRWVVFQSAATNLTAEGPLTKINIFLRDQQTTTTVLVSVNSSGLSGGNGNSINPTISDDGRYVAFESLARDFGTNGTPASSKSGIFLRDLVSGNTSFISSNSASGTASRPVISADGRFVAFESNTNTSSGVSNIYCLAITNGFLFMLSTNRFGTGGGSGVSFSPQFTPDGRYCIFLSYATNLVDNATNQNQSQVFRRDMETGLISLVSGNRTGVGNNLEATAPSLSADGRVVAFQSYDGDLVADDFNGVCDVFTRDLFAGITELVSRRVETLLSRTSLSRAGIGTTPVSSDGRCVLFASTANNLVTNDTQSLENLYVRDLWIGSNQIVTASLDGVTCGNGMNFTPAISGNGRWVVFQSTSTNLVTGDTNSYADLFVRDLFAGNTYPVSKSWRGASANQFSVNPAVSSNGQFVVFQSLASNITPLDANTSLDVFVRDLILLTNIALSVNPLTGQCVGAQASTGPFNVTPYPPLITPDGQWAVLWSMVNLTTNVAPTGTPGLYAKQIQTGLTLALGFPTNGVVLAGNRSAVLSPGGRFVAFTTTNDLIGIFDFSAPTNVSALGKGKNPSLSVDGRWLAFESPATNWGVNPGNSASDIFVQDRQQNIVRLVSANHIGTASGNGPSTSGLISADGRFVVFQSLANDLVNLDSNGRWDVFVRDLLTETTFAISANTNGTTGSSLSRNAVLGSDGRTVVFESFASDLATGDFNQARDVFVLRLSTGDSDADGMDDDWEVAYFGNLSRDGTGDADADGATDFAEFRAGTIPNDNTSVLRVITMTALSDGTATLFWSSVPGITYRLEYKDDLTWTIWSEIPGAVFATGTTASATDSTPGFCARRFYRVRVLN